MAVLLPPLEKLNICQHIKADSAHVSTFTDLLTYLLTHYMEQSRSWEANQFTARQEFPRILWNAKVHYHVYKSQLPFLTLRQINPVHAPTSHFLKVHVNSIPSSTTGSSKWSLSLKFPHLNAVGASPRPHTCYTSRPHNSYWLYNPKNIGREIQVIKLFLM
jgi:acyl-homoserine lactone acylase PvdQ